MNAMKKNQQPYGEGEEERNEEEPTTTIRRCHHSNNKSRYYLPRRRTHVEEEEEATTHEEKFVQTIRTEISFEKYLNGCLRFDQTNIRMEFKKHRIVFCKVTYT